MGQVAVTGQISGIYQFAVLQKWGRLPDFGDISVCRDRAML